MSNIKEQLAQILGESSSGPFLFLGSGFSRRYLNLEDWKGLLARFCVAGRPFEYYLASADGNLPKLAEILSADFHDHWWKSDEYAKSREKYKLHIRDKSSALRIEISHYLSGLSQSDALKSEFSDEVLLLSQMNVDGIITTNWDSFLEQIFPDYKVYIGQDELLFSNPQGIGEIYKIHGCSSKPESMVLTSKDYEGFEDKNPYLASKLITTFVEHPIVFIGYSLSDPNISSLIRAISRCIGPDRIEKLRRNLIFVRRPRDKSPEGLSETYLTVDQVQVPLVLATTSSLLPVYEAINEKRRKIPARILRYCKEQLYEIVKSSTPEAKLAVVDLDDLNKSKDIEFVVGVGVSVQQQMIADAMGPLGYSGIKVMDIIDDLLSNENRYDPEQILSTSIQSGAKGTPYCPVFKYLRSVGITNWEDYKNSGYALEKWCKKDWKPFKGAGYARSASKFKDSTISEVIENCTPENSALYIPFLKHENIDRDELRDFLIKNRNRMDYSVSSYATQFRKLACFYDKLKWGW